MNYFSTQITLSSRSFLTKSCAKLNDVISRNAKFSCITSNRKKVDMLRPNMPSHWEGGKPFYGFTYYPRYPDQIDPDWERTPLFMIRRRRPCKGLPHWEKRILRDFRIEQNRNDVAIVINCEHVNERLWKIKHAIIITPITFPDGIPEEKDLSSCRLYENGELRFNPSLEIDANKLEATETFQKSLHRVDKETIQQYTRRQWNDGFALLCDY